MKWIMDQKLNWTKGVFDQSYQIKSGDNPIGHFKEHFWGDGAEAEINEKRYRFQTKGFLNQNTQIIDGDEDEVIGNITYNTWRTKAHIHYPEGTATWENANMWGTKYKVVDEDGNEILFNPSFTNGTIDANTQNDLLLLTGLFVANYYWQVTFIVMMMVVIIIAT